MAPNAAHFVYILRCADGSYYVGSTQDLQGRVATHNAGGGPPYTRRRLPVVLVYSEPFASTSHAVRRERQLKRWSRAKKAALIAGNLDKLKKLSKRRT
jgi:predicted GIY-YIG superfamily endonuclease